MSSASETAEERWTRSMTAIDYSNGDRYQGSTDDNGLKHGYGKYTTWANGDFYDGEYQNDTRKARWRLADGFPILKFLSWAFVYWRYRTNIVRFLFADEEDNYGNKRLHKLCLHDSHPNEAAAIQRLGLLMEKFPEAVRHANNNGYLPIHFAAWRKSPEFCQLLIEAYPGSEQIPNAKGRLPLHLACRYNTVDTVEYLYAHYPEAIDHATTTGYYPIHCAIMRDKSAAAVEIVRFLLDCDPNQKLKQCQGVSLLGYACGRQYNDSRIGAGIQMIEAIFDAHPEAIEDITISADIESFHHQVQEFINGELVYARQAEDYRLMTTPDDNGQLPLHRALQNNVRLGSIKLLVKGNPFAVLLPNNSGALPLHIACESNDSTKVIEYLVSLDPSSLNAVDRDGNTALHYACRGLNHDSIALLLETYDAISVSKRNAQEKLPLNLLWESGTVDDRESVEYMGSVFQLLRAFPEMLAISN